MSNQEIRVTYHVEKTHLAEQVKSAQRKTAQGGQIIRIIGWTFVFLTVLVSVDLLTGDGRVFASGLALTLFAFAISGWQCRQRVLRTLFAQEQKEGPVRVTFDDEMMRIERDEGHSEQSWRSIDLIEGTKSGTLIGTAIHSILVPDTSLPKALTREAFLKQLTAWKAAT